MKRFCTAALMALWLIFGCSVITLAAEAAPADSKIEINFWQGDFLIFNVGDWPENVNQKLANLQKNGKVQVVNETAGTYATSFLDELVTFQLFFYQNELYKIEISFPEKFTQAEYDTAFKDFLYQKLRPKLTEIYGPVNNEHAFPANRDIANFLPFATLFSWSVGLNMMDVGICREDKQYFAKVSIYDLQSGLKAFLETEQKELEEIKRNLEAIQKSAQNSQ